MPEANQVQTVGLCDGWTPPTGGNERRMSDPTTARLLAYEQQLARIGAPVVTRFMTGLSADAMDALTEPLGLRLPAEARAWWGWHDGATPDWQHQHRSDIAPMTPFVPLADSVDAYRHVRAIYIEATGEHVDEVWPPAWLPFSVYDHGDMVAFDCSNPSSLDASICLIRKESAAAATQVQSLAGLIDLWSSCIEAGAWAIDTDSGKWLRDETKLPATVSSSLLHW